MFSSGSAAGPQLHDVQLGDRLPALKLQDLQLWNRLASRNGRTWHLAFNGVLALLIITHRSNYAAYIARTQLSLQALFLFSRQLRKVHAKYIFQVIFVIFVIFVTALPFDFAMRICASIDLLRFTTIFY